MEPTFLALEHAKIVSVDFRDVICKISFSEKLLRKDDTFVYLDPVYLDTEHYYRVPKWTKEDTADCFELMANSGMKCALSEFDHPFILEQALKFGFEVIELGTRQNIKNRRKEVLVVNYEVNSQMRMF